MKKNYFLAVFLFALVFMTACKKEEPEVPNEEEVITTVKYTLTPTSGGNAVVFEFKDLDGDGGNAPVITNGVLQADKSYTGAVTFFNESETPVENITEEVEEEAKDHQLFYSFSGSTITVNTTDTDGDGNVLGLKTTLTTTSATTEKLTITLKHEPKKPNNSDISVAGGETDIEVVFDVEVQ